MFRKILFTICLLSSFAWGQAAVELNGNTTGYGVLSLGPQAAGASLQSISVTPANSIQSVGQSVTYSATATYSDGSSQDVTSQALWTIASGTAASNQANFVTCNQAGSVVVEASLSSVSGTTGLTCQSLQISPTGTLTATQSQPFAQPFTASGGVPPYTFSSVDLPGWLSLSNTGCDSSQINCDLNGTQNSIGSYTFHITVTDALLNPLTVPITVQVIAASTEDNRYCNSNGTTTVAGQMDGPANMIQQCVYDAIANTPASCIAPRCTVPVLYVCPPTQLLINGFPDPNCNPTATPPYYNTIQAAFNALSSCGQRVVIYDINYRGGFPIQNPYDELLVFPGVSCGPNDPSGNGQWIWVMTKDYSSIPNPGTRITPAYAGQTSLPGRPSFPGPATPGIYVPLLNPSLATCTSLYPNGCPFLILGGNGVVPSGVRFMGLEFAWTKTHQTAPGFFGPMIEVGCNTNNCAQGASYIIFDRIIAHACQDKSDVTCTDAAPVAIQAQNQNYTAIINSYFYGFKTLGDNRGFLGPQDESHVISGGNIQGMCHDGPTKIVNNFLDSSSQPFFFGGSVSDPSSTGCPDGAHPYDLEIRRNGLYRPLNYMVGPFNPENNFAGGSAFDMWVASKGTLYPPSGEVCYITPPPSGVQATCNVTITSNKVSDAQVVNPGTGYTSANPGATVFRYPNSGANCGTAAGCEGPAPTLSVNTTGGTIASGHKISVAVVFVHSGDGYITDPQLNAQGNVVYTQITTAGCTGGGCQVVVTAPALPTGFSGYAVYDCDATNGACTGQLQAASASCINITSNCVISTVGSGSGTGNVPGSISEANLFIEDGIYIVKNNGECKHCVRELFEGNVATHNWTGQADEFATCWLYRPTNDLEGDGKTQNCPNCKVIDVVNRYNACRGASKGISIGLQQATRGGTLAAAMNNVSIHDDIFELSAMWITATSQYGLGAGTPVEMDNNGQPGPQALQNVKVNHITTLHTEPAAFSQKALQGSLASFLTALCGVPGKTNTNAVLNGITYENSIGGGGFRNISQKSSGCFQCLSGGGNCNSTLTLNSKLTNSGLAPISAGAYTTNELTGIEVNSAGSCSVPISSCSITGDGTGAQCTAVLNKDGSLNYVALNLFGQGYTHASVTLGGCNGGGDVLPTTTVLIGGAGNPSPSGPWCSDHNMNITNGWPGEDALLPDPSAQGDTTNACFSHTGGGWVDVFGLADVGWQNVSFDATNNLPVNWGGPGFTGTDDLHLTAGSAGHNASNSDNQGRDIANGGATLNDLGADVDLVLLYTGCTIQNGVMVCP